MSTADEARDLAEEIKHLDLLPDGRQLLLVIYDVTMGHIGYAGSLQHGALVSVLRSILAKEGGQ
jgi:hypothetical protein